MLSDWILRLRSLFKRRAVEQDLDDELRFHFEHLVESQRRQGIARDEAVRRARLQFGGIDQIKEEHRDARGIGVVDDLGRDLRHAARQIRRSPGFALLAVLCLGLGIGVNTSIFGVLSWFLLRPMPVEEPDRLVMITRGEQRGLSYPLYREFRSRTRGLSAVAATFPMESDLDFDGESDFVAAEVVSVDYAQVFGFKPVLGRWFVDEREPAAVISYAVWERRFHLNPSVLGRVVRSEAQSYTVIGVAPREFGGVFAPLRTDLWVPIQTRPKLAARLEERQGSLMAMLFGRLRDDTTTAQAAAELNAIDTQLRTEQGAAAEPVTPIAVESVRGIPNPGSRRLGQRLMTLLMVVVGLVLLIACVNVGNLLLVRGALRQRELAMRRALGASRSRLLRQLLTESLLLAVGGGVCGILFAFWTNKLLQLSFPTNIAVFALQIDLSLDWRAIVFATIVSLLTTVLCGLLPAWRTSGVRGLVAFKGEIGAGPPRRRPVGLVVQVVMSLVLLFVAGSFVQALLRLQATDPGFDVAGRLYAYTWIPSPPFTPESRREFYSQSLERLRALPGVRTVALTSSLPLMPTGSDCAGIPGSQPLPMTSSAVDIGYFDTMGVNLISGRTFTIDDLPRDPAAMVVVNESLARKLWPDRPATNERVMVGCTGAQPAVVVGVVADSAIRSLGETPQPHIYRLFAPQHSGALTAILLDTSSDPAGMVEPVRRALVGLGQGIRVYAVQPLSAHVEKSYAQIRWMTGVLSCFGLVALLLAAVGVYGTIAYRVTLRTQEIGVRMALGASRGDVFREVLRQGLAIVLVGVTIGELLTAGLTVVAGAMQEGIRPTGVSTHIVVGLVCDPRRLCGLLPACRTRRACRSARRPAV